MDKIRTAKFTSSEIVSLTGDGKRDMTEFELSELKKINPKSKATLTNDENILIDKALTYIKTKIKEFHVGGRLDREHKAKPTTWGSFCEHFLVKYSDKYMPGYTLTPKETNIHPLYPDFWAGSKDGNNISSKAVIDLKCPFTLESFSEFAELHKLVGKVGAKELLIEGYTYPDGITIKHRDGEKFYWQLVSNAAIDGVNKAELIVFIPTEEILTEISDFASIIDAPNLEDFYFIANAVEGELPCLPSHSSYQNKLTFEFDIPKRDIDYIENKVKLASKILAAHTTEKK